MDMNELLNPVNENNMHDNGMEEEIHQVVLERHEAEQYREKNASDSVDDNLEEAEEVKPSYQEALAATLTLSKYVAHLDKPPTLTNYFIFQDT
jgi:hypothetical protein